MKLKISHPEKESFETDFKFLNIIEIEKHIDIYMKSRNIKKCNFELNGEAKLVDATEVSLFG